MKHDETGRKPARRDQIVTVVAGLFAQHGVRAVTTRQIAQATGISHSSLYANFASAQEIRDEVSARAFALLADPSPAYDGNDPLERLQQAIASYFDFGLNHPQAYRIAIMIERPPHPEAGPGKAPARFGTTDHPGPRAFGQLRRIVGHPRSDLCPDALEVRTQCLWAGLYGMVSLLLARPHVPWADQQRLMQEHAKLALQLVRI